ncbi:MAG: hypothetical protein KBG15_13520, partial [Kofleriaceae bacterium]|nr:hypothetical protein [Kofleriaceae bacterium]
AIVGGREFLRDGGKLEEGARPHSNNNFQGRYAIRHAWEGAISCKAPIRGRWGGPWESIRTQIADGGQPKAATNLAFAPRGAMALPTVVQQDIPELALKANSTKAVTVPANGSGGGSATGSGAGSAPAGNATGSPGGSAKKKGCGCQADGGGAPAGAAALLVGLALFGRRRSRRA